jgi:hypothetical protein
MFISTFTSRQTKRFSKEVYADVIALTGAKFFYITRQLTSSIIGTIISYEVFLIQFQNSNDITESAADPCHG